MSSYGLLGYPLAVSFSPAYFADKFKRLGLLHTYSLFPMAHVDGFRSWVEKQVDLAGLNVTIPHKQAVLGLLDVLTEEAKAVGAVNTIGIQRHPLRLTGHNTDVTGFGQTLLSFLGEARPAALVFGTGGAARAVWYVLTSLGIPFLKVGRTASEGILAYEGLSLAQAQKHLLWINTTPLGMEPTYIGEKPRVPYAALGPNHCLYDLVYHPAETPFLAEGRIRGAKTQNGLAMLHAQAEASWDFWQKC
jgi:shikimate dehydrogenase